MNQLASLISTSTENLYKFLFINGMILVILSMFYPLDQKNKIELDKIEHNKNIDLLNKQISFLKNDVFEAQKKSNETLIFLDSLSKINTLEAKAKIKIRKDAFNSSIDSLKRIKENIDLKIINVESNRRKIIELSKQADNYSRYSIFFLIFGIIFFIVGLFGWYRGTKSLDELTKLEIQDKRKRMQDIKND